VDHRQKFIPEQSWRRGCQ